jgi:2-aminoethylphosphonate-pyruvate transaminase
MSEQLVLLNPGPVNTSERVRRALQIPDACHREEEFYKMQANVRARLLGVFGLDPETYTAVLFTASGTAAIEACVSRLASANGAILVVSNGVYGERICEIARRYGTRVVEVRCDITCRPDLGEIERAANGASGLEAIAVVHHETTTGLINPIPDIGRVAKKYRLSYFVDAISGLAGEELPFAEGGISACAGTANKCIQGLPGISFVLLKRAELERMERIPPRNVYLDIVNQFKKQAAFDTSFTPALQVMSALNEALSELAEETVPKRIERYKSYSSLLRAGFAKLGLEMLLDPRLLSNTITTLRLPDGVEYEPLHDFLKERGFIIYAGQGQLKTQAFRVANMGFLKKEDLERFVRVLGEAIDTLGSGGR